MSFGSYIQRGETTFEGLYCGLGRQYTEFKTSNEDLVLEELHPNQAKKFTNHNWTGGWDIFNNITPLLYAYYSKGRYILDPRVDTVQKLTQQDMEDLTSNFTQKFTRKSQTLYLLCKENQDYIYNEKLLEVMWRWSGLGNAIIDLFSPTFEFDLFLNNAPTARRKAYFAVLSGFKWINRVTRNFKAYALKQPDMKIIKLTLKLMYQKFKEQA